MQDFINKLKLTLLEELPGQKAQYLMAPSGRKRLELNSLKSGNYIPSAVMLLICADEHGKLFIPLIERMKYKGAHSGQISLPGGKYEPADLNLKNTAIRETQEEIGLKKFNVIGSLTQLHIPVSGFLVQPFIGYSPLKSPELILQQREVKAILKLELDALLRKELVKNGTVLLQNNTKIKTPYFEVEDKMVWGATAMILSELKELVRTIF